MNLCLVTLLMFVTFGCSGFLEGFKKGYNDSRGTSNSSEKPNSPSSSSSPTVTQGRDNLSDHIIGSWTGRSYDNSKRVEFYFSQHGVPDGSNSGTITTKGGTATTRIDGVEAGKETYRIVDDTTIEFETNQGMRYRAKVEISTDREKMTLITTNGITTSFQRQ